MEAALAREDWQRERRTWRHPECTFFIVEREVPELALFGRMGSVEYHVMRAGGARFTVCMFDTLDDAIAEAERLHAEGALS